MRNEFTISAVLLLSTVAVPPSVAQQSEEGQIEEERGRIIGSWNAVEREADVVRVPLDIHRGRIRINATVNGKAERFVFDTGSPTILTKRFADTLNLVYVGRNTGRDANGVAVSMDLAIVGRLDLGGVTFLDVPVMVHDYSAVEMGACMLQGGVIGSEILPGSIWHIDPERSELKISAPHVGREVQGSDIVTRLYDFGYPHAPIIDYSIGDVSDRMLFDTGNAGELVLYDKVAEEPSVMQLRQEHSVRSGRGSEGISAGGRGSVRRMERFVQKGLHLGANPIAAIQTSKRTVPPSLIGSGILREYSVLLDYPANAFVLRERASAGAARIHPGFAITVKDEKARITQLFEASPAGAAGLRLGDQVVAIDGRVLPDPISSNDCETIGWLMDDFDPTAASRLHVRRASGVEVIDFEQAQSLAPARGAKPR